jgi:hypothetical protein
MREVGRDRKREKGVERERKNLACSCNELREECIQERTLGSTWGMQKMTQVQS